jgi:hypothetical protein
MQPSLLPRYILQHCPSLLMRSSEVRQKRTACACEQQRTVENKVGKLGQITKLKIVIKLFVRVITF